MKLAFLMAVSGLSAVAAVLVIDFILYKVGNKKTLFHETWKTVFK